MRSEKEELKSLKRKAKVLMSITPEQRALQLMGRKSGGPMDTPKQKAERRLERKDCFRKEYVRGDHD